MPTAIALSFDKTILLYVNLVFSIAILFAWSYIIISRIKHYKSIHINICLHSILFVLALIAVIIGMVYTSTAILFKNATHDNANFVAFRCVMGAGAHTLRLLMLGVCIERYLSTLWLTQYDGRKFVMIGILLVIVEAGFGIVLSVAQLYWHVPNNYIHIAMAAITVVDILCVRHLLRVNSSLRRAQATLNENYYVVQNLKILKTVQPHIIIHSIFGFTALVMSVLSEVFRLNWFYQLYFFYSFYPIYYLFAAGYIFWQSQMGQSKNRIADKCDPMIKGSLGKTIPTVMTTNEYFNALNTAWK